MEKSRKRTVTASLLTSLIVATLLSSVLLVPPIMAVEIPPPVEWFQKEPYTDYAQSGLPDFDQRQKETWKNPLEPYQGNWSWCGPVAVANCFWWMDSRFETGLPPPAISDTFPLVQSYGAWDDKDPQNVQPLVEELARLMGTDVDQCGTNVTKMEEGIRQYLINKGLEGKFYERTWVCNVTFEGVYDEIHMCEDVILLLGFYEEQMIPVPPYYRMVRVGGHYVTVAGVGWDMEGGLWIKISDPILDYAEDQGWGPPYVPVPHSHLTPSPYTVHNNATLVSHDPYRWVPLFDPFIPGRPLGCGWGLEGYNATKVALMGGLAANGPVEGEWQGTGLMVAAVEAAVLFSPLPPPPPWPEDLELYPREVVDLEYPDMIGTQWHELHPDKGYLYNLTEWEPGMVLSPEDMVAMYGPVTAMMESFDFNPLDPYGSHWHELEPYYCQEWILSSWEDNGDGKLGYCDQIDMTYQPSEPGQEKYVVWYHVQDIFEDSPGHWIMFLDIKYWFQVDEVTVDMLLDIQGEPQIYVEYQCGLWTFDPENPIGTKWKEIPVVQGGLSRCLNLTSWIDNGNGVLDHCDTIDMTPLYPYPGQVEYYHVSNITISLMLNPEPSPPVVPPHPRPVGPVYLESALSYYEFVELCYTLNPVGTEWHEIYPVYFTTWTLGIWINTPFLSPSDWIMLELKDPETHEPIPGTKWWYHVDKVTVAMNMTSVQDPEMWRIVKFEGSLKEFKKYYWTDPYTTQWHEVNPEYCRQWHLIGWADTSGDGNLSYCDHILMMDKETGDTYEFHVESLSTDIYVTRKHPIEVINVTVTLPWGASAVFNKGSWYANVTVTVENQGYQTETFNVTAYYDSNLMKTSPSNPQTLTLNPGQNATVTFKWNVTAAAPCTYNYTGKYYIPYNISINVCGSKTVQDGTIVIRMPADANGDGHCSVGDLSLLGGSWNQAYPSAYYKWRADFNGDGKVYTGDLALLGINYGKY